MLANDGKLKISKHLPSNQEIDSYGYSNNNLLKIPRKDLDSDLNDPNMRYKWSGYTPYKWP